jgi:hypothetical protein
MDANLVAPRRTANANATQVAIVHPVVIIKSKEIKDDAVR